MFIIRTEAYFFFKDYDEFLTNRVLLVDMPRHDESLHKVPLDGTVSNISFAETKS